MTALSQEEIKAELIARITQEGKFLIKGLRRKQLAKCGIPCPLPKGWLKKLMADYGLRPQRPPAQTPAEISAETPVVTTKLIDANTVTIYTDGACVDNPGPGGWSAVLMYGEHRREIVGSDATTTNNRMELMAAISALESLAGC